VLYQSEPRPDYVMDRIEEAKKERDYLRRN